MACWEVHKFFWSVPHLVQWFSHFNALLVQGFSQPAMFEDTVGYPHCLLVLTHGIHVSFSVDQITIQSLLFSINSLSFVRWWRFFCWSNPHYLTIVPSHCCWKIAMKNHHFPAASNHTYAMSQEIPLLVHHHQKSPWKIPMKSWKITMKNHHPAIHGGQVAIFWFGNSSKSKSSKEDTWALSPRALMSWHKKPPLQLGWAGWKRLRMARIMGLDGEQ